MASIDRLAIRGIRAFSPDYEQVIEFESPLTMIVGENGCGKTTIIECLKYACSGSLPPGSRNGQSFVNDPQMSGKPEVKASIKMKFRNRNGHAMVCTRNFSLTQKRSALQFRALDGAITTKDEAGRKVSTSHKCSDLDREIPQHLGVSDAILENVIFCHQEDSNWPLQEGKELKTRFDAIFESTRYTKAMDAIKKARKEYNEKVQEMKVQLAGLNVQLENAQKLRAEMGDLHGKVEDNDREANGLDGEIDRLAEKIAQLKAQLDQVQGREAEITQVQWRIQQAQQNIREKEELIDVEFVEGDDELQQKLESFDEEVQQQQQRIDDLEKERATLATRMTEMRGRQNTIQQSRGQLMAEKAQLEEMRATRNKIAKDVVQRYKMPKDSGVPAILLRLNEQLANQEELSKEVRGTHQTELREIDQRSTDVQRELSRIGADRKHAVGKLEAASAQRATLQADYGRARRVTRGEVDDAKTEWEDAKSMYDRLSQGDTGQQAREQLRELEASIRRLQTDLESEKAIIDSLKQHKDEIDRAKHEERQFANQEAELSAQLQATVGRFESLFPDAPKLPKGLAEIDESRTAIVDKKHELEAAREASKREVDAAQQQLTTVQTLWNQHQENARVEKARVKELQAGLPRIQQLLDDFAAKAERYASLDAFDEAVTAAKSRAEEAKTDLIVLESRPSYNDWLIRRAEKAKRVYDHYICPCCDREMNDTEYDTFKQNQESFLNEKWRSKVERKRTELEDRTQLLSDLEKFLPSWHELQEKRQRTIQLDHDAEQLREDKDVAGATLQSAKVVADELNRQYETAMQLAQQISALHEQYAQLVGRQKDMAERQKRSQPYSRARDGRSLDEVELQYARLLQQKEELQNDKDKMHAKERQLNSDIMQYLNKKNSKQQNYEELSQLYDRLQNLEEQMRGADETLAELKMAEEALAKEERPLVVEAKTLEDQKRRVQAQAEKQNADVAEELNSIRRDAERLRGHHRSIEQLESKGIDERFAELEREFAGVEQRVQQLEAEVNGLDERRQALAAAATNSASARRTIQDNLALRASRAQLIDLQAELEEMQRQVGANIGDIQALRREHDRTSQELGRRHEDRARLIGAREQLDVSIRGLEAKLGSTEYRDIDGRHRRTLIEFETTKYAVLDLDNYWGALDRALSNYHTLKIREVNKIIKDIWRLTYRGEDIDTIEIRSGEESGSTRAARSYNYRVVMSKNGTELDMRGRCSAGQRVLACLVIRLALAETFCLHCGILALDEPTTNLDEKNKEGLAHALALIIAGRARQHNFQLVCITHEWDFVTKMRRQLEALNTFTPPRFLWLVRREKPDEDNPDEKFFSKIFRQDWDEMGS